MEALLTHHPLVRLVGDLAFLVLLGSPALSRATPWKPFSNGTEWFAWRGRRSGKAARTAVLHLQDPDWWLSAVPPSRAGAISCWAQRASPGFPRPPGLPGHPRHPLPLCPTLLIPAAAPAAGFGAKVGVWSGTSPTPNAQIARHISSQTSKPSDGQTDRRVDKTGRQAVSTRDKLAASEGREDSHWVDSLRTTGSMPQAARLLAPCTPFS